MNKNQDFARKQLRKAFTAYLAADFGPDHAEARMGLSRALNLCKLAGLDHEAEFAALQG